VTALTTPAVPAAPAGLVLAGAGHRPPERRRAARGEGPAAPDPVFEDASPQRLQRSAIATLTAMADGLDPGPPGSVASGFRRRGAQAILGHLAEFPGGTWQERWQASGLETAGARVWAAAMWQSHGLEATAARTGLASGGLGALIAMDVIRPGFGFVFESRFNRLWCRLAAWRGDPDADVLSLASGTQQTRSHAAGALGRLLVLTGRPVRGLRAGDVLAYREAVLARRIQSVGLDHVWACLAALGAVEGTLRQALRPGQRTVAELVGSYGLKSQRVRNLMVAYLTERAPVVDYSTLRGRASDLCGLFWRNIERIAPGIDTIDLPEEVARQWKEEIRWRTLPDGSQAPRANTIQLLMSVRGFYADLHELARDDPARWAPWACRPPIAPQEVKAYTKWRHQHRSAMHERARTRTVRVTELADVAERRYHQVLALHQAATHAQPGQSFTTEDVTWTRVDQASHSQAHPRIAPAATGGTASPQWIDTVQEEEDAFWGLAIVEVLRHTGIRIEEMLELTQLDLHEYQHRDPAVGKVLLLHVNPSKLDQERMLVISPEVAATLAAIVRRVRSAAACTGPALPSLVAYDYSECKDSEPLPFLFQRTAGKGFKGSTRPINKAYVQRILSKVCRAAGITDPAGNPIAFTPHDFRRVFATEALAAGLPPHIIQKLLGHASLSTTQGYAAIFPDDIIRSHRAFTENRRQLRPSQEYRPVTSQEWDDFEQHFAKRKIAIGDCMRAYGTNCHHEYACEQCKLARPDPAARPRLERTRQGLLAQLQEAQQRGWAGETDRLTYILAGVDDKLAELERLQRRTTWLPTPPIPPRT
jgi:integrase